MELGEYINAEQIVGGAWYAMQIVFWLIVLVIIVGFGWYLWYKSQFRHHVTVKEVTSSNMVISFDKARIYESKNKTYWAKLWRTKRKVPSPPSESKAVTTKGKLYLEYYLWQDTLFPANQNSQALKNQLDKLTKDSEGTIDANIPLSPGERVIAVEELVAASRHKTSKWWSENAGVLVSAGVLIMMFVFIYLVADQVFPMVQKLSGSLDIVADKFVKAAETMSGNVTIVPVAPG